MGLQWFVIVSNNRLCVEDGGPRAHTVWASTGIGIVVLIVCVAACSVVEH